MKTLIVYVHLISACIAVGILLIQDLALAKTRGKSLLPNEIDELKRAATTISRALVVLWISGLTLVLMGYLDNPREYLLNEKLWAKFAVVVVLTVNGFFLHHFSFPRVVSNRGLLGLGNIEKTLVALTGSTSTVSWLFACYLGIARPWNYTVEFGYVMFVYLGFLMSGCSVGCIAIHVLSFFDSGSSRENEKQQARSSDAIPTLTERVSKI
ncbi:MAG: DUF2214 domain-containing protein [Gammaproteobacteria bacterium]|nr:MAG: DUF2214 domain-containing protein [Gammaproteobacteria bacterium]